MSVDFLGTLFKVCAWGWSSLSTLLSVCLGWSAGAELEWKDSHVLLVKLCPVTWASVKPQEGPLFSLSHEGAKWASKWVGLLLKCPVLVSSRQKW